MWNEFPLPNPPIFLVFTSQLQNLIRNTFNFLFLNSHKGLKGLIFKWTVVAIVEWKNIKNQSICRLFLILKTRHEPVYAALYPKRLNQFIFGQNQEKTRENRFAAWHASSARRTGSCRTGSYAEKHGFLLAKISSKLQFVPNPKFQEL